MHFDLNCFRRYSFNGYWNVHANDKKSLWASMTRASRAKLFLRIFLPVLMPTLLFACGKSDNSMATGDKKAGIKLGGICRLAVSMEMGRPAAIVKVDDVSSELVSVSYVRPDDGKLWKYQCKAEGENVYWRGVDLDGPGSGLGRWRDNPMDNKFTFSERNGKLTVKMFYPDGSQSEASLD